MAEQNCYCGVKSIEVQDAAYYVDGADCCTRECYNHAVALAVEIPLDKDGFMWGGPPATPPTAVLSGFASAVGIAPRSGGLRSR